MAGNACVGEELDTRNEKLLYTWTVTDLKLNWMKLDQIKFTFVRVNLKLTLIGLTYFSNISNIAS